MTNGSPLRVSADAGYVCFRVTAKTWEKQKLEREKQQKSREEKTREGNKRGTH